MPRRGGKPPVRIVYEPLLSAECSSVTVGSGSAAAVKTDPLTCGVGPPELGSRNL